MKLSSTGYHMVRCLSRCLSCTFCSLDCLAQLLDRVRLSWSCFDFCRRLSGSQLALKISGREDCLCHHRLPSRWWPLLSGKTWSYPFISSAGSCLCYSALASFDETLANSSTFREWGHLQPRSHPRPSHHWSTRCLNVTSRWWHRYHFVTWSLISSAWPRQGCGCDWRDFC